MNLNFNDYKDPSRKLSAGRTAQDFLRQKMARMGGERSQQFQRGVANPTDAGDLDTGMTSDEPAPLAMQSSDRSSHGTDD